MRVPTTYAEAAASFPTETASIVTKFRRSTAKSIQGLEPDQVTWYYCWAERIKSIHPPLRSRPLEDRINYRIQRSFAWLQASCRHWWTHGDGNCDPLPQVVIDEIRRLETDHQAEQERIAALSSESRQAELKHLLKAFVQGGGTIVR